MHVLTNIDKKLWIDDFEYLRNQILNSNDNLKNNYSKQNLDLNDQDEATIVYDNKIIAFSFLQKRKFWGNINRSLSRYYIIPEIRSSRFKSGNNITKLMLNVQIKKAISLEREFVFISRKYPSFKWQNNFISVFNEWKNDVDHLYQVCQNNSLSCWQHCVYLNIKNVNNSFNLPKVNLNNMKICNGCINFCN